MLGKCRQCQNEFSYLHKQKDRVVCDSCKNRNKYINRRQPKLCEYCRHLLPFYKHKYCTIKCRKLQEQLVRHRLILVRLKKKRNHARSDRRDLRTAWRIKNKKKLAQYWKDYRKKHPEKSMEYYWKNHEAISLRRKQRRLEKKRLNMQVIN